MLEPWQSLGSLPGLVDLVLRTELLRRRLTRKAGQVLDQCDPGSRFTGQVVSAGGFGVSGCLDSPLDLDEARAVLGRIDA